MKNFEKKYQEIEAILPTQKALLPIKVEDNGEPLLPLENSGLMMVHYIKRDMVELMGTDAIYVRKGVYERLFQVACELKIHYPHLTLKVVYGYRSFEVQRRYYRKSWRHLFWHDIKNKAWPRKVGLRAHWRSAHPLFAGHTTGGAVDLTIFNTKTGRELGMGTPAFRTRGFGRRIYTFSPEISKEALKNRILLQDLMKKQGFYCFPGEFWHFSYGEREWAWHFKKKNAIYGPLGLKKAKQWVV